MSNNFLMHKTRQSNQREDLVQHLKQIASSKLEEKSSKQTNILNPVEKQYQGITPSKLEEKSSKQTNYILKPIEVSNQVEISPNSQYKIEVGRKLKYFEDIQNDLKSSSTGGLLVMSSGTGLYKVIGEYLDSFDKGSQTIFFLLNFDERDSLKTEIHEIQSYTKNHEIVDAISLLASKRRDLYNKGGVFLVTDIILLFDLLGNNIIQAERITGFIINRIHTTRCFKENLSWLCTLLKMNNPSAIILGISECEQTLDTGVSMSKRMKTVDSCLKQLIPFILRDLKAKKNYHDPKETQIFTEEEFMNSHQYILEDKIKSNKFSMSSCLANVQYVKDAFDFKQLLKDLFHLNSVQFYQKLLLLEANSNEDSFINKTAGDKFIQSLIKQLFESAQKRVYELKKSQDELKFAIKNQNSSSIIGKKEDNQQKEQSDNLSQNKLENQKGGQIQSICSSKLQKQSLEDIHETINSQESDTLIQSQKQSLSIQRSNDRKNSLQQQQQQSLSQIFEENKKQESQEDTANNSSQSESEIQRDDLFEQSQSREKTDYPLIDSTESNLSQRNKFDSQINKSNSQTHKIECEKIPEEKEEEIIKHKKNFEEEEDDLIVDEEEEKKFLNDAGDVQQEHLEGLYDDQGAREREIETKMQQLRNLIEQDPSSLFINTSTAFDTAKTSSANINKGVGLVEVVVQQPQETQLVTSYSVKLNLDIDPKLKCLQNNLDEIYQKYKDQLPINGEKFLIWIHTNDRSRVNSIQEYIQNAFLKQDTDNRLSLMRKCKYFLNFSSAKRQKLLAILMKKQKLDLQDKKESEAILLESLLRELELLFSIIEYEQLDLNKQSIYQQSICQIQEQEEKQVLGEEENSNQSQLKDILSTNKRKRQSEIKDSGVKKRKLIIDEAISKRFKILDIQKLNNVSLIDELDGTGQIKFLSEQVLPNFEIIVNSTNKSVIRQHFIKKFRPNFIILYEPNTNIIREVTVYQHLITQNGVNPIYELRTVMFQNSNESEKVLYNLTQENKSTENLVKEKNNMASSLDDPVLRIKNITKKLNTRIGGQVLQLQPTIIADKREFRSDLPTVLFHEGFKIVPIQLATGDYILSKDIAVERKSVETPDLVQSLKSGRLYSQLSSMSKSYRKNYLLIEFSEQMPFSLDSINYNDDRQLFSEDDKQYFDASGRKRFRSNTITFYLPLLVSQFDNVKILWSKGPQQTSRLFQMLKQNQLEPNVQEFIKEQDKSEKKEVSDKYIELNNDEDSFRLGKDRLFEQIQTHDEDH